MPEPTDSNSSREVEEIWAKREVSVSSVAEFVEIIDSLLPAAQTERTTSWWFRGQSNHEWGLEPSFLRITGELNLTAKQAIELERAGQAEFRSKAHLYLPSHLLDKVKTDPCWWAVMQHHGAPTRLVDWTISPYVAAYFAAQQDGFGKDGVVWCFCSGHLKCTFEEKYRGRLPDFTEGESNLDVQRLHEQLRSPTDVRAVAPLAFPFISSERIAKQQGRFTMCLKINQRHDCISKQLSEEHVRRIRIHQKDKPAFLSQLRLMNITASAMFPGIDGLGRSVAELVALGTQNAHVSD